MQQLQQSSLDFIPLQTYAEQHQIYQHISLIVTNLDIDQCAIIVLKRQDDQLDNFEEKFCQIISSKMPQKKVQQQSILETLTLCFYRMIVYQYQYLSQIERRYEDYLSKATYVTNIILFHEKIRKFCKELRQSKFLGGIRKKFNLIIAEIDKQQDKRLEYLKWKIDLCSIIFEIIFANTKIQRSKVIYLLKRFKSFKKLNIISRPSLFFAFKFITESFILANSELYQFFYRELKTWKDQIQDKNIKQEITKIIQKCQKNSSQIIHNIVNITSVKRKHQSYINTINIRPKIIHNELINNERAIKSSHHSPRSSHRVLKRRLSKEKCNEQFKKVDIFLKSRQTVKVRSSEHKQKIFIMNKTSNFLKPQQSQFTQSRQKFKSIKKKQFISSFKSQKSFLGTFGRKFRKRMDIYNKIKAQRTYITKKNLSDEKYQINYLTYQRTRITIEQILLFNNNKTQEIVHETHTFEGSHQDLNFHHFTLSFYNIFNSEYAMIQFTIHNQRSQFIITCKISSTYCLTPIDLKIQHNSHQLKQFSVEDLQRYIIASPIYYEALQQKIERKISVLELQEIQQMFKHKLSIQLGKSQLAKVLIILDIIQSQLFWYYGKSCYITGNRLQKKSNIDFQNLSAFAVSLGKFKSDYFSCLDEIELIQNVSSIVETCVYLSHGRMIVHKQFRLIKGKFYLQVIQISNKVYKSFSRKFKKLFFNVTMLERKLISFQSKTNKTNFDFPHQVKFDLKQCLDQQNTFIFFMKNIVENMIQKKYLKKIQNYLQKLNITDNFEYFSINNSSLNEQYSIQVINNDLQANEINFKEYFNQQIINLQYSIRIYCQAYKLVMKFKKLSQKDYLMKINDKFYIVRELKLQNQLKVLQVYRNKSRSTYKMFLYHQEPLRLSIFKTAFQNRLIFKKNKVFIKNSAKRQIQQTFIQDDNIVLIKKIIKYKQSYCFISLTQCQSLSNYRIDYYFPNIQEQFSTYLDQHTVNQYFGNNFTNLQLLSGEIENITIDQDKRFIVKHNTMLKLFKHLGNMALQSNKLQGYIQLIMSEQGLKFLYINYTTNMMSVGPVEEIKCNNKMYAFSSILRNKTRIQTYHNIILRLYNQLKAGHLSFYIIDHTYFKKE